jgi:hypothetical protein
VDPALRKALAGVVVYALLAVGYRIVVMALWTAEKYVSLGRHKIKAAKFARAIALAGQMSHMGHHAQTTAYFVRMTYATVEFARILTSPKALIVGIVWNAILGSALSCVRTLKQAASAYTTYVGIVRTITAKIAVMVLAKIMRRPSGGAQPAAAYTTAPMTPHASNF